MTPIAVALWGMAAAGIGAVAVSIAVPARRRVALVVAACLFLPIGIAGILSIGSLFLLAAVMCLVVAGRTPRRHGGGSATAPEPRQGRSEDRP